jgi:transposase
VFDILQLKRQGLSISQIAAITGFNRRTVHKYLAQPATPRYGPRAPRPTKLDPFKPFLQQRLAQGVWNATVLLRELQARGYAGGYTALKDYLQPLRQAAAQVAVRRFETPPGQQAQVDWGHLGAVDLGGAPKALSAFVFTLGHSRAMFADLATDQTLPTFLRMHERAFAQLGGVPREILYDRVKTVVLGTDERGEVKWHPTFLAFARYWGFTPRLCRAYRPQTKGKVENGIGYLRKNFLCGRLAADLSELSGQLHGWVWGVANQRIHGTTHRCVAAAWEAEKPHLQPLGNRPPFPLLLPQVRRVAADAYVSSKSNRYSVPWQAAGQEVFVREADGYLEILREQERLARHRLCAGRHQVITVAAHHADLPLVSHRRGKKPLLRLGGGAPTVEARSLAVYEALAQSTAPAGAPARGGGAG